MSLGNLGSAVANLIATNGYEVLGSEYQQAVVVEINRQHTNTRFLPGVDPHPNLSATPNLSDLFERFIHAFIMDFVE